MAYLAVEGDRSIYYERYRGSARPVVLVHGWGMGARIWDTVLPPLLAAGHEVVVYDQRSCGRSDKDFADVSIDALGSDVVRLVDHLELLGVVVSGWSLGGAVAVDAVAKLGPSAAGLVLTGGATPKYTQGDGWEHGATSEQLDETLAALSLNRPVFLNGLSQAVCAADPGPVTVEWMWQMFMQTSPRADESLRDLGRVDQRDMMKGLDLPALVMHGDKDVIVAPGIGAEAARILPKGRLVPFAQSGHAPFLEEHENYCSELLGFISSPS
jgi:non-heme chloroperoxidase